MAAHAERAQLIANWARLINVNAASGALLKEPVGLKIRAVLGPRAAALEILAGVHAGPLLDLMNRSDKALLRQLIPWEFVGVPAAFMQNRYVRLEAGWPFSLAEAEIRLSRAGLDFQKLADEGAWVVGRDEHGRKIGTSFKDRTTHFLLGGATGSGKTTAIQEALTILSHSPSNRFVLIDGKLGDSLGPFRDLTGRVGPLALDLESAKAALAWVHGEMLDRYRRKGEGETLEDRIIVVFDEFQQWAEDEVVAAYMAKIAAQGRAAKVHLMMATQHPTVGVFGDPATPREIAGRLALYVTDSDASRVVVGSSDPRADRLLGAGDAYYLAPGICHRVQVYWVDKNDFEHLPLGEPELEAWPAYSLADNGPDVGRLKPVTAHEAALAVRTAIAPSYRGRPRGRGYLADLMSGADLDAAGTGRLDRILQFGRSLAQHLQESEDVMLGFVAPDEEEEGVELELVNATS